MDFFSALEISASGLTAERERVNIATSNLANADTTRGPNGQPYRRLDPVLESTPFENALGASSGTAGPAGVRVANVVADQGPGKRVYSPGHPDADAQGFVTLPDVDPVHEMVNLVSASRNYDANASALETLKTMAQHALDIAR